MKKLGFFYWNNKRAREVVEIEGKAICLNGWDWDDYKECFEVYKNSAGEWSKVEGSPRYTVTPVYDAVDDEGYYEYLLAGYKLKTH